jgi:hypothetical protein
MSTDTSERVFGFLEKWTLPAFQKEWGIKHWSLCLPMHTWRWWRLIPVNLVSYFGEPQEIEDSAEEPEPPRKGMTLEITKGKYRGYLIVLWANNIDTRNGIDTWKFADRSGLNGYVIHITKVCTGWVSHEHDIEQSKVDAWLQEQNLTPEDEDEDHDITRDIQARFKQDFDRLPNTCPQTHQTWSLGELQDLIDDRLKNRVV